MNNVNEIPVDIEEMQLWANGYRNQFSPPLAWSKFAAECDIAAGTLQPFCTGKYQGDNERIARDMFKFMQSVETRKDSLKQLPVDPGFFESTTSLNIRTMLKIAHTGRITVVAAAPGTGKTMTVKDYCNRARPVWHVTMMATTGRINPMISQVQAALHMNVNHGYSASGSRAVMNHIDGKRGLLVIDEAQHLNFEAFEEIRAWHDATDVGICFLGNTKLLDRIQTGRQSDDFAQLNSRIARRMTQFVPLEEDVEQYCEAWQIADPAITMFLKKIAATPSAGGLRECTQLLETASMLAAGDGRGIEIADLHDAQSTRATRWVKT